MSVAAAREAYARGDWRAAYDALDADRATLDTGDLDLLGEAAWWLGDSPGSMAVSEEVYQRLVAAGAEQEAADRALRLTLEWFTRGDVQIALAWLARARRLLGSLPRCALHGYLAYLDAAADLELTADPELAEVAAAELRAFSQEFDDPALACFSLALSGLAGIRRGRTAHGFADLDEAMLPVLAGHVDPLWSGDLYCTVIHLCDELADLSRMRAWTDALARWSRPRSETFLFAGVTRVHELQLAAAEGDWVTVEQELGERSADLVGKHGWLAGEGYYTLGEVRRLRGDAAGARTAFGQARELGHAAQPGEALLLASEGRCAEALDQLRVALAERDTLARARMLLPAVSLALREQEPAYAMTLAAELESTAARFGTPGLRAAAAQGRATLHLAAGDAAAALPLLTDALATYRDQRHRHAMALVHEQLAAAHRALGEVHRAAADVATARAIYGRLGAEPDLARTAPAQRPGGLTAREVEVLRLVAGGASNRDVAAALTISDKTVSRHLANIFTKLDVSSRTAAAGWSREHGL
ncbi:helix-turn-helix domain-containing protein [Nocardioides euryhalodurans]|uniref:LuxR family transcriptional regulator n=1 Tax=Nocardioides euryhalodurans TaxID=2518370 RepID=A0A4P7GN02_9ACTN|nr:helix-turn-helix transcriptional regulator [Nocardioides euryhalodurans]QBR93177.1 LuxR family transcriptional regulator [Nocardioides euryhalodurans]